MALSADLSMKDMFQCSGGREMSLRLRYADCAFCEAAQLVVLTPPYKLGPL